MTVGPAAAVGLRDQRENVLGAVPCFCLPKTVPLGPEWLSCHRCGGLPVPRHSLAASVLAALSFSVLNTWPGCPLPPSPQHCCPPDGAQNGLSAPPAHPVLPRHLQVPDPESVSTGFSLGLHLFYAFGLLNPTPAPVSVEMYWLNVARYPRRWPLSGPQRPPTYLLSLRRGQQQSVP